MHELGHVVAWYADDKKGPKKNYGFDVTTTGCDKCDSSGHCLNSPEYASAAAVEGFADYYGALVFNKVEESADCSVVVPFYDWNQDGVAFGVGLDDLPTNCEGPVFWNDEITVQQQRSLESRSEGNPSGPWWGPVNYMEEECDSTPDSDIHTEYDWMKFLWDINTDGADRLSFTEVLELWDRMDPHDWAKKTAGSSDSDKVANRLEDAAAAFSAGAETLILNEASANGVDH